MSEIKQWDVFKYPHKLGKLGVVTKIIGGDCYEVYIPSHLYFVVSHLGDFELAHDKVVVAPALVSDFDKSTGLVRREMTTALYTFEEFERARDNYSTESITWRWPYSIMSLVIVDRL